MKVSNQTQRKLITFCATMIVSFSFFPPARERELNEAFNRQVWPNFIQQRQTVTVVHGCIVVQIGQSTDGRRRLPLNSNERKRVVSLAQVPSNGGEKSPLLCVVGYPATYRSSGEVRLRPRIYHRGPPPVTLVATAGERLIPRNVGEPLAWRIKLNVYIYLGHFEYFSSTGTPGPV